VSRSAVAERPPAVDPRIEARRREVHAEHRARRWRLGGAVAALAVLAAGLWGLSRSPVADVDHVDVVGNDHVGAEEVVAAAELSAGDPLLEIDPAAAAARVGGQPWVARAQVARHWRDGRVVVEVLERTPVAILEHPGAWALVDASGRVLAATPRDPDHDVAPELALPGAVGLVRIQGLEPAEPGTVLAAPDAGPAIEVAAALTPGVADHVAAVRVVEGRPELALAPQGWVRLCDASSLDVKLRTLATVLAEVDLTALASVDVCVPDTAVLTREGA
jgi:cell division protein FtsQ